MVEESPGPALEKPKTPVTLEEAMQIVFACLNELNTRLKVIEKRCPHVQGLLVEMPDDDIYDPGE